MIKQLINNQRMFFNSGKTHSLEWRLNALKNLRKAILLHEENIINALSLDLKKSAISSKKVEIDQIITEIDLHSSQLNQWVKAKKVRTPFIFFPTTSFTVAQPRGVVLIISPWNFPFSLTLRPLIGAISAGNCALLKPSEFSPHSSQVIAQLINSTFSENYIAVMQGDAQVAQEILTHRFDYIFFTGSTTIGTLVMQAAAQHLTPLTLELGGCNPCFVDTEIDLKIAAKRIAWGKFHNAGQSCLAPNFVAVDEKIEKKFIEYLIHALKNIYHDPTKIGSIINQFHFERLIQLLGNKKILHGGNFDRANLRIEPTVIETDHNDQILRSEIFGPILPIISYQHIDKAIARIHNQPLAVYLFSNNEILQKKILETTVSGGVCINDVGVHYANPHLPFGGVGMSGFGSYHSKKTFDAFSHFKSVMKRSFWFDWPFRYKI
ncbi:MAG: Aldehyde dehydrogenase [Candidatus Dependentiae bacterium ADurb.Bin331]|nr:MAG: Aldehyde dehydrogenase [Candidatus Dependentiae bacterium ADurb.Bin331]